MPDYDKILIDTISSGKKAGCRWSSAAITAAASIVGASMPVETRFCLICGKPFDGRGRGKFCSNACRQRNKYAKIKELRAQN